MTLNRSVAHRLGLRMLGVLLSTALGIGVTYPALSAETGVSAIHTFHIAAGPLEQALNQFTVQSGLQALYDPAIVKGREVARFDGAASARTVLSALLRNSGLIYTFTDPTTVVIKRVSSPSATTAKPSPKALPAPATSKTPSVTKLQPVTVVGTLLPNVSPTSPVITINRADIVRNGYTSVQDVMADVPQNFAGQTAATGNVTAGNLGFSNEIDIRGLGPQATLTLIDGHRVSSAGGDTGRAVDVNMIPISAIDRIDILTDGASALYGSDAIGGVVNIVLRKDFTGAESTLQYGSNKAGGLQTLASQAWGTSWDGGHFLGTVQYTHNDAITSRRLGYDTSDYRSRGGSDSRVHGYGSPGTGYPAGYFQGLPFSTLTGPNGEPIYFAALPPLQNGRNLQPDQIAPNAMSSFDAVPVERTPTQQDLAAYLDFEQNLGAATLFADFSASRRRSRLLSTDPSQYLFVPTTNAFSPFKEPVFVGYQMKEFGPYRYDANSLGWFGNLGLRGKFGNDWTWEAVGTASADRSDDTSNQPNSTVLNTELASSDPNQAFNPFGNGTGQSPGVVNALRQYMVAHGKTNLRGISGLLRGSIIELSGGDVRLALGGEFRRESMSTSIVVEGVGGFTENEFPGLARNVDAIYGEAYIPLVGKSNARSGIQTLALSVAARYSHYSDFGSTTNPKIGVVWKPMETLALKANWGTSFRAPSLSQLSLEQYSVNNVPVLDPSAPGGPKQVFITVLGGGNPHLHPEKATTWTVSADYSPQWLQGVHFSADYFHSHYHNRIRGLLDGLTYFTLLQYEDSLPPRIVVRDAQGNLVSINNININSATTDISGWDAAASWDWNTGANYFGLQFGGTVFDEYKDQILPGSPLLPLAGRVGNPPRWRARLGFTWSRDPWAASLMINHTDREYNDDPNPIIVLRDVSSLTTIDVQLSWSPHKPASNWLHGVTLRIGANDLFDQRPPFVDGPGYGGFDARNYPPTGRLVYVRLSKAFGEAAQ